MRLDKRLFSLLICALMAAACSICTRLDSAIADPSPAPSTQPDLGIGASLHGRRMFPPDNWWNRDVSGDPVDPDSDKIVAGIGLAKSLHPDFGSGAGAPIGIPYIVVPGNQPKVPVTFTNNDESDPGPYPIPPNAPIEGGADDSGGDRHVIVLDRDNWILYELFAARPNPDGSGWAASSGAIFNLNSNKLRPKGWTSCDAAGLPILPGLVRYDEVVEQGHIDHALRFTVRRTRASFIPPATHFASRSYNPIYPPMGMRVRLKASVDLTDFPQSAQVILKALKQYGMFVADNGGNWFLTGAPDPRWNDQEIETLKRIHGSDFEVIQMSQ